MCGISGFQFALDIENNLLSNKVPDTIIGLQSIVKPLVRDIVLRGSDALGALITLNINGKEHTRTFKTVLKKDAHCSNDTISVRGDSNQYQLEISVKEAIKDLITLATKECANGVVILTALFNARGVPVTESNSNYALDGLPENEIQPFFIKRGSELYAVAHNGIFYNDKEICAQLKESGFDYLDHLPEIDSYVPVKLMASKMLSAEKVMCVLEGSAAIALYEKGNVVLDRDYLSLYVNRVHFQTTHILSAGVVWSSLPMNFDVELNNSATYSEGFNAYCKNIPFRPYSSLRVTPYVKRLLDYGRFPIKKSNVTAHQVPFDLSPNLVELYNSTNHLKHHDTKAVVICSGGLDSAVALGEILHGVPPITHLSQVTLLYFKYGALAEKHELEAVKNLYDHYSNLPAYSHIQFRIKTMDMTWLKEVGGSSLTAGDANLVTDGELALEKATEWVPARNLAMISATAALCDAEKIDYIVLGLNREESGAFNDNSTEFCEALNETLQLGTQQRPVIVCPLGNYMKSDIVRAGIKLNVPVHLTWSCYRGNKKRCGTCGPCLSVKSAFNLAQQDFPFNY